MRDLRDIFSSTLFLGMTGDAARDEERLWMIAEHMQDDEHALAFLSLKQGNLLLTQKRLLELKPHLDMEGFWNVISFKGYSVKTQVYLREVLGFYLEAEDPRNASLRLQVRDRELVIHVPVADASEDPRGDLEAFGACLQQVLKELGPLP
jgi:hypothetical protein